MDQSINESSEWVSKPSINQSMQQTLALPQSSSENRASSEKSHRWNIRGLTNKSAFRSSHHLTRLALCREVRLSLTVRAWRIFCSRRRLQIVEGETAIMPASFSVTLIFLAVVRRSAMASLPTASSLSGSVFRGRLPFFGTEGNSMIASYLVQTRCCNYQNTYELGQDVLLERRLQVWSLKRRKLNLARLIFVRPKTLVYIWSKRRTWTENNQEPCQRMKENK